MLGNIFQELMGDEQPDEIVGGTSITEQTQLLCDATAMHRACMAEFGYPQPGRWPSIMYAFQELGEFIDAYVTRPMTDQKRNNEKDLDPVMELGDTLAMLCTSLLSPDDIDDLNEEAEARREVIGQALYYMGVACLSYNENAIHQAIARVAKLSDLVNVTPRQALEKSNKKIRDKHAVQKGDV